MSQRSLIFQIWKGNLSNFAQFIYIILVISLFTINGLIAQSVFPTRYSIFENNISNQGGISSNPEGYLLWNIIGFFIGLFLIPQYSFIFRRLSFYFQSIWIKIFYIFGLLSCFGFSLVAVFPEDFPILHKINAVLYFIGALISYNSLLPFIISKWKSIAPLKRNKIGFVLIYLQLNLIFIGLLIVPELKKYSDIWNIPSKYFNFPFWEWLLFTALFVWLIGIIFLLPKTISEEKVKIISLNKVG